MEDMLQAFDWERLLWGEHGFLLYGEILFRTVTIYVIASVLFTIIGKRGRQEMTPFEYMVIIALGSATGDVMFYPEVPLLYAIVVIIVIVLLSRLLSLLQERSRSVYKFFHSKPSLLISRGEIKQTTLRQEHITRDELYGLLRAEGVEDVGHVKAAYLEASGDLSILLYPKNQQKNTHNVWNNTGQ